MRFMDSETVDTVTTLSSSQRKRLIAAGEFPEPVRISRRRVAWVAEEIEKWCAERIEAARAGAKRGQQ